MTAEEQVEQRSFLKTMQPSITWHGRDGNKLEASLADRTIWQSITDGVTF